MPKPYDRTTHDGNTVDWLTKTALLEAERRLGYELTITQGSYNAGGVSASAGTHDGGGVVDLAAWDHERKVRVLREVGFAAWYRPAIRGLWPEHIHAVLIGNDKLAPSAANQVTAYRNRRDGLKSNAADNTWHPDPIRAWKWVDPTPKPEPLPPKPARKTASLRVVTENIRHALPDSDVEATLARLTSTRADIICLQEMSGRRPQVEEAKALGFDNFTPNSGVTGEAMCPILFRSSVFELRRAESVPVGEGGPVPRQAAGPSHRGPEFITYAALLHKATGRTVHVFNVHLPPSLQLPEMRRLAEAQVRALADLAAKVKGQVIVTGDFNSTKPLDLAGAALRDAGFRSNHEVLGTLITHEPSQRPIDAVLFRGDALTPVSQRLIPDLPSDHLPLLVRFTLAAKES